MKCEANGCLEELEPRKIIATSGEDTGLQVTEVPERWCIRFVENSIKQTERLVVLCPMHSAGVVH